MTKSEATTTPLHVYLFGRLRFEGEEESIDLPTRKVALLLAYLLLHPGSHSREKLAALFWGDVPDASARASLRNALSTLRRQIDGQLLRADRQTAQLNPTYPIWVDAQTLQTQAIRFLEAPVADPNAVDLDLYTADLLADFYDDWVLIAREHYRGLYLETLLELVQQLRSQSEYERAIEFAERAIATDGANERAHQHLMFCHVALGDRQAALRQYETCREALADELAVEPSAATKKLYAWIRQRPLERMPVEASITNLPIPLTSFVGRQSEMAGIKERLSSARLLTLTGAGGSGKTRLAIQVASDLLDAYGDGVWWVELADLSDGELLSRTVAKALGVPEVPNQTVSETLVNFLRPRQLLLVLDNCEHLIATTAQLAERLLGQCPQLKVLATSREMLGIAGEQVWPVPTLSTPELPHSLPVERLQNYEAIRLFVGRASAVNPNFALTEANAVPVTEVCRRLDGLPLAIELAAARINVLTVEQIAARLDDAFRLLRGGSRTALPRYQTLRAAIDWSHDLLSAEERTLFRRLSVFAGGWDLPAAETICVGEGIEARQVFELLSRLVDKSLVEAQPRSGEARFRMLQTVRQYSHERLLESSESATVRGRHLVYFRQLVEEVNPHLGYFLSDPKRDIWLGRLELEYDNLRAAIRWCLEKDQDAVDAGLRLVNMLHWFWFARGRFSEGQAWLSQLLESRADVSLTNLAQGFLTRGYLACWRGEFSAGRAPLERALRLFKRLEDGHGIAFSMHGLGFVALGEGNAPLSRSLFEASLKEAREMEDEWLASFALHFLAIVLTYQGEYSAASAGFNEGNAILRRMGGYKQGLAFSHFHLGRIARIQGDYPAARSDHAEGMRLFQETGDRRGIGYSLAGFAALAAAEGNMERAARLSGAVASLEAVLGPFLEAPLQIEYERELVTAQEALGEDAFAATAAEGRAMTMEQALAHALEAKRG